MTDQHLRLVVDDPPDLDEEEGGGDDGDGSVFVISAAINGDTSMHECRLIIDDDAAPEEIARHLVMAMRGAVASFDVDVQMAFERRLLHWGDQSER